MDIQNFISTLKNIRTSYGDDIFLNADRLCAYLSDMTEGRTTGQKNVLIKTGYRLAEKEMPLLINELIRKGYKITTYTIAAKHSMVSKFMPEEDVCCLLEAILGTFGEELGETVRTSSNPAKEIHVEKLKQALTALNDKYQDSLWKDGQTLSSLLADQTPMLITERQLIERVYDVCGDSVRKLVRCIVKEEKTEELTARIQISLKKAYVADKYIDDFLLSVLELFGREYKNPLAGRTGDGSDKSGNSNKGTAANRPPNSAKTSLNVEDPAVNLNIRQAPSSGSAASNPSNPPKGTTKNVQPTKKKRKKKILPLICFFVMAAILLTRLNQSNEDTGQNKESLPTDSTNIDDGEKNTEQEDSVEEEALYTPRTVTSVDINIIDATVYDSSVTDLQNYVKYEGKGKKFSFGFPTGLYDKVDHIATDVIGTEEYLFTGTDGSSLSYILESLTHRYTASEWREERVRNFTDGMSDVNMLDYDDGEEEGRFYLNAKDGNMDVYIAGYLNIAGGPACYMTVKIPPAENDEDRMIKEYYIETLCCLADFFDSAGQGMSLRTYEDFLSDQGSWQASYDSYSKLKPEVITPTQQAGIYEDETICTPSTYRIYEYPETDSFCFRYPIRLYDGVDFSSENEGIDTDISFYCNNDPSSLEVSIHPTGQDFTDDTELESYKNSVLSETTSKMTDVEILADRQSSSFYGTKQRHDLKDYTFYLKGKDSADPSVIVYQLYHISTAYIEKMILKYPKPEDMKDLAYKDYYAECMYDLCKFGGNMDCPDWAEFKKSYGIE